MAIPVAGIINSGAGLVSSLQSNSVLCQFQDSLRNTLVEFDAVFSEDYTKPSAPTAYPVEDGTSVSDHIQQLPLTFSLTAIVTDSPLTDLGDITGIDVHNLPNPLSNPAITEGLAVAATALVPPLGIVAGAVAASLFTSKGTSPSLNTFNQLRDLQLGGPSGTPPQPFTVVTKLGRFDNMMIANLKVNRDENTGNSLTFQLDLVQVIIVSAQVIPPSQLDAPTVAASKQSVGEQQAKPAGNGGGEPPAPKAPDSIEGSKLLDGAIDAVELFGGGPG